MRLLVITACAAISLALLPACGDDDTPEPGATTSPTAAPTSASPSPSVAEAPTIVATDFSFSPRELRVAVGTSVQVRSNGDAAHTFTSKPGQVTTFDVALDQRGAKGSVLFDKAGTVQYVCTIHEGTGMTGSVIVAG